MLLFNISLTDVALNTSKVYLYIKWEKTSKMLLLNAMNRSYSKASPIKMISKTAKHKGRAHKVMIWVKT